MYSTGVEIAGISMQRGQCTVYLTNEDDVTSALQKDKQYIGPRYVDGMLSMKAGPL